MGGAGGLTIRILKISTNASELSTDAVLVPNVAARFDTALHVVIVCSLGICRRGKNINMAVSLVEFLV